jgi:hypothetical protein
MTDPLTEMRLMKKIDKFEQVASEIWVDSIGNGIKAPIDLEPD